MGMFHKVKVGEKVISPIDWEMSPDLSFGTFESWGGRERVRDNSERVYYFFVDDWGSEPKLCLMERGVKHAKIMAEIVAPAEILQNCVDGQGHSAIFEKSYAINKQIKEWLIANVLDGGNSSLIVPMVEQSITEDMGRALPGVAERGYSGEQLKLPTEPAIINDGEIEGVLTEWNFYDGEHNPEGRFDNVFADAGEPSVLIDLKTNLMWQRGGLDIHSSRTIQRKIVELNRAGFAGFNDWRLPTMEEAMSLMEREKNQKDIFLDPVFSKEQPFVFVAAKRQPGGYWFVDYKQGRAFWSSGTIPGGFGRLVRSL